MVRILYGLLFAFFLIPFKGKAQTVYSDYLDGVVYAEQAASSSLQLDPYVPGSNAFLDSLIQEHQVDTIAGTLQSLPDHYRIEFSDSSEVDQLVQGLEASSVFDAAEKMPYFTTSYSPNDPFFSSDQWYLHRVDAPQAWDSTKGDSSVRIAIVDNAVSTVHEDIVGALWNNADETDGNSLDDDLNGYVDDKHGYDVADSDGDPNPPSGSGSNSAWVHGTHVGGIAGAETDNGTGMAGVGFQGELIAVKCSPNSSSGDALTHAYEGVDYAIQAGADVINMSFGSSSGNMVGSALIQQARSNGITLVGAAGNSDTSEKHYPAAYPEVIAVGATNTNDEKAYFSNYGDWIDVMAPGTGIRSTLSGGSGDQYGDLQGTSMASPLVAGVASLILSVDPGKSPSDVEQVIEGSAEDISSQNPSYTGKLGAGRVNAHQAVNLSLGVEPWERDEEGLLVRPQPNDGSFELLGIPEGADRYRLNDQRGRLQRKGPIQGEYERFSFPGLDDGVYYMWILGEDVSEFSKVLIRGR